MRRLALLLAALVLLSAPWSALGRAQQGIDILSEEVRSEFPEGIAFELDFESEEPVKEVRFRYAIAPDGSEVRRLIRTDGGSMAQFTFRPGTVSPAVRHRRVEEIWYVVAGHGRMWRSDGAASETVDLAAGVGLSIPAGTSFQVAVADDGPLVAVGVTMPPWPPGGDADVVDGIWPPLS